MYSHLQLAKKYSKYYLSASNSKGHGVHSPFVFEFIKFVLNDKQEYDFYKKVEAIRKKMLANNTVIEVEDFGAGSTIIKTNKRVVKSIAASSLKPKKYSQLLARIIQYYNCTNVLELGTSLGVTTALMAFANNKPAVTTMEGSQSIAYIAQQNFAELGLNNVHIISGNFDNSLPIFLQSIASIDLAFLDGNHKKKPTLQYFAEILQKSHNDTILIFDDIHWSAEMEDAWAQIKLHTTVTLTIDLFFIGIVFIKKEFKVKQHFVVRF